MKCSRIGMPLVLGLGSILNAADAYTFTSLEVPGGKQTNTTGINDLGTIVGFYFNNPLEHGFALQKGTYTTLDVPGSPLVTSPRGINFQGDIVGQYALTAGPNSHGFVFQGSVFTTIDFPGAQQTTASGINSRDETVGGYVDNNSRVHGFLREKDHYTAIDVPFRGASGTFAIGINDSGEIVGFYLESNGSEHGFIKKGSAFDRLDVPFLGVLGTNASGINNKGDIVGTYLDSDGLEHGFVLSKGVFTRLDARFSGIPDVNPQTAASGINDLGEIVGTYTSAPSTSASSPPYRVWLPSEANRTRVRLCGKSQFQQCIRVHN